MAYTPDEDFTYFLEKFGKPQDVEKVPDSVLESYQGKLPKQLLTYWEHYGFCSFQDGLLQIVNPDDYQSSMEVWLHDTGIMETDNYYVIARSGFGDLYLWGENNGNNYIIEPRYCMIFSQKSDNARISKGFSNEIIRQFFGLLNPNNKCLDLMDVNTNKFIFKDAVKKLGSLAKDEMFTFVPAFFLGGEQTLANVDKVNIFIQLDLLSQMGQPKIMTLSDLAKQAYR